MITGTLLDLLRRHFAAPEQLEDPDLKNYLWNNGPSTGILIASHAQWRGQNVEKRPAVIVRRNSTRNVVFGLANRVTYDILGHTRYSTGWVGSHSLFCLHGSGAGAEILSTEVQREITQFADVIERELGLLKWAVVDVGAITPLEEARQDWVVPVTVGWAYTENWKITHESLKLRRLPITLLPFD